MSDPNATSHPRSSPNHILTLPLCHLGLDDLPRSASWLRGAMTAGSHPPLFLVHDLGALLTQPRDLLELTRPDFLPEDMDTSPYIGWLKRLTTHPLLRETSNWAMSDAVVGVTLATIVKGVQFPEVYAVPGGVEGIAFTRRLERELAGIEPEMVWRKTAPGDRPELGKLVTPAQMAGIESNLRRLDPDELRFLCHYGPRNGGAPDPCELLDLFTLLDLPASVGKSLSQVLRLLPRVSASVGTGGVQTYAMGGYKGLTHKGSLDSLVPTELAYGENIFLYRLLNGEALYYGREGERERRRDLAYIVTQAGLETMGDVGVLAQGLTLAVSRAMEGRGYEVRQSFAGSHFTDPARLDRPGDIHRLLYYRDAGWLKAEEMLVAVLRKLKEWKEEYWGMEVFWVVEEHWDADEYELHKPLYDSLKKIGGQHAWFIRIEGKDRKRPDAGVRFHRSHVVETELLWQGERGVRWQWSGERDRGDGVPEKEFTSRSEPRYRLRSEPINVSEDDFREVFRLDEHRRPRKYVENEYEDNGDGKITDHATGLTWQQSGSDAFAFEDVEAYIEMLNLEMFGGHRIWRLPTIEELMSLLEPEKRQDCNLYISPLFSDKQVMCCSSDQLSAGWAWVVSFVLGGKVTRYDFELLKDLKACICVRAVCS